MIIPKAPSVGTSGIIFVVFLVATFLFGEGINILRIQLHPVPRSFRQALYEERGNEQMLGLIDRMKQKIPFVSVGYSMVYTGTKQEFWPTFKIQHNIDDEFEDVEDIYRIFLSYIGPKLSSRARRFQTIIVFVENTIISFVVGILGSGISWELSAIDTQWFILTLIFYIPLLFFGSVEPAFVNYLFVEYFADQTPLVGDPSNKPYR